MEARSSISPTPQVFKQTWMFIQLLPYLPMLVRVNSRVLLIVMTGEERLQNLHKTLLFQTQVYYLDG